MTSFALFMAGLVITLLAGCEWFRKFPASGVPSALTADGTFAAAATNLSMRSWGQASSTSRGKNYVEMERDYSIALTNGTREQLMTALHAQAQTILATNGVRIHGRGQSGAPGSIIDFSFHYAWEGNEGIVRAYSFGESNRIRVVIYCYEHR